jgi:hypothetical protein
MFFEIARIHVAGYWIHIYQHRFCPGVVDGMERGRTNIRWKENLVIQTHS